MGNVFDDLVNGMAGIVPLLETVAPSLAAAAGGPLAGQAVSALEGVLGLTPGAGPAAIGTALTTATPEQLAAVQTADNDFKLKMAAMGVQLQTSDQADRDSARKREEAVKDTTPAVLGYVLTIGFFGLLGTMLFHAAPDGNNAVLNVMVGSLGTAWVSMVSYYYGSSSSSAKKDVMLANSVPAGKTNG